MIASNTDDDRIEALAPRAMRGEKEAREELLLIYRRGNFDPGFGLQLDAFLHQWGLL